MRYTSSLFFQIQFIFSPFHQRVNREVLYWLKEWDECVFNKKSIVKSKTASPSPWRGRGRGQGTFGLNALSAIQLKQTTLMKGAEEQADDGMDSEDGVREATDHLRQSHPKAVNRFQMFCEKRIWVSIHQLQK